MNRRSTLLCSLFLLLLLCGLISVAEARLPTARGVIIIMADDMGYGDISPYGGWIKTPNLERLAREGIRFTDFHSSGNVCSPTRAGLMTGRYQQRAGIPGVVFADPTNPIHKHGLQQSEFTIGEAFRKIRYETAIFGKWHLGYEVKYNPINHGFDTFRGYVSGNIDFYSHYDQSGNYDWWHDNALDVDDGYTTRLIDRYALEYIEKHQHDAFFLYLPHEAPHYPFQRPSDPAYRSNGKGREADWEVLKGVTKEEIRERYRVMVEELDKSVGNILDLLDQHYMRERTLIFFLSDNGAAGKWGDNTPLRGAKGSNWEGGHRVPAIVSWKGVIPDGKTIDQLAISLDIMPTVLAAAAWGPPPPETLDGMNLLPILTGEQAPVSRQLVWNGRAVRDGDWKLIENGKGGDEIGLYNLRDDLAEKNNLAGEHPERVKQMQNLLKAWKADMAATATKQP